MQFAQIPGRVSNDQRHQGDRSAAARGALYVQRATDQRPRRARAKPGEDSNGKNCGGLDQISGADPGSIPTGINPDSKKKSL